MNDDSDFDKLRKIRKAARLHPPTKATERLAEIREILNPTRKTRKEKRGHDRMENGGNDRQE